MKFLSALANKWINFWFEPVSLLNLAIFRIILGSTLFFLYLGRSNDVTLYYGPSSIIPKEVSLSVIPEFYRPYFMWFFWSDSSAPLFHGLFVLGLLLFTIGLSTRWLTFLTWILGIGFLQRNYALAFGADLIGTIFLLYCSFTQCFERLSLKSLILGRMRKKKIADSESDDFTRLFTKMVMVQLCVIYVYTGFEKLKGGSWWDGTALWAVFANPQMVVADFTFMQSLPLVIVALTFFTVIFEIYFTPLVFSKSFRIPILIFGLFFHLGIGLMMALFAFAFVMLAPYVLFLKEDEVSAIIKRFKQLKISVF